MGGYHPSLVGNGRLVRSPSPLAGDQDESVTIFFNVTDKVLVTNKECLFYSWLGEFYLDKSCAQRYVEISQKTEKINRLFSKESTFTQLLKMS